MANDIQKRDISLYIYLRLKNPPRKTGSRGKSRPLKNPVKREAEEFIHTTDFIIRFKMVAAHFSVPKHPSFVI